MPYTPLVSVFVGVTNVIPFFGPFLGSDSQPVPDFTGKSAEGAVFPAVCTGAAAVGRKRHRPENSGRQHWALSSLWVIIAILVGGSFFGVAGMFFGVPVCACLYNLVAFMVDRRLAEKDLPVESTHYTAPLPESEKQEKL